MKRIHLGLVALLLSSCSVYSYADAEQYTEYTEPVFLNVHDAGLKKVTVDWILGEVKIVQGDKIGIAEESIGNNYLPLYYRQKENELAIKVWKSGTSYSGEKQYGKRLILTLPKEIEKLEIDVVSADYSIELGDIDYLDIDAVSGNGAVIAKNIDKLDVDSVSGEFSIEAESVSNGEIDTVSGRVLAKCQTAKDLSFSSVSGDVNLSVKDSSGLSKIKMKTTSGNGDFAFDGVRGINVSFNSVSGEKNLSFTDGSDESKPKFDIEYSSISGDLAVSKSGS